MYLWCEVNRCRTEPVCWWGTNIRFQKSLPSHIRGEKNWRWRFYTEVWSRRQNRTSCQRISKWSVCYIPHCLTFELYGTRDAGTWEGMKKQLSQVNSPNAILKDCSLCNLHKHNHHWWKSLKRPINFIITTLLSPILYRAEAQALRQNITHIMWRVDKGAWL